MVARVKKNDTVMVVSGKDKGKQGVVLEIWKKKNKAIVKGIAVVSKHAKARKQGESPGIKKQEAAINLSVVMPLCGACKKPCRINAKELENGKRARICNRCKEIF